MSTDLQDLLREGLDRLTAGATVPDGLVGRAQQHNRQRRIRIRAAIAAGTAMAAVAAAVTVSLAASGNQPSNAPVRTQTIADVATRTEQALAAAVDQGKAIQVTRMSSRNMPFGLTVVGPQGGPQYPSPTQRLPGAHAAVTAQSMMSWQYRDLYWQEGFSAAGRLVFVNANGPITLRSGKQVAGNYGAAYPVHVRWRTVVRRRIGPGTRAELPELPIRVPELARQHQQGAILRAVPPERAAVGGRRGCHDPGRRAARHGIPRHDVGRSGDLPAGADERDVPVRVQPGPAAGHRLPFPAADPGQPGRAARGRPARADPSLVPAASAQ